MPEQMTKRELIEFTNKHVMSALKDVAESDLDTIADELAALKIKGKNLKDKAKRTNTDKIKNLQKRVDELMENFKKLDSFIMMSLTRLANIQDYGELQNIAKQFGADSNYTDGITVV